MSDPRTTPDPSRCSETTPKRVIHPYTDICRSPNGPRDRQALYGASLTQLSQANGWSYVQTDLDGYVGYVLSDALGGAQTATHRVATAASTLYTAPDLKSADLMHLPHGSLLSVTETHDTFAQTPDGYAPTQHLTPLDHAGTDPATIAALYLGTPYLWGGNSGTGIDCSGLIQAALTACNIPCPGDSDQQMILGEAANAPYKRNDLLFWKGHVALVTDPETMIHANAHAMATCFERIETAIARIQASGDGPVTAHRRL